MDPLGVIPTRCRLVLLFPRAPFASLCPVFLFFTSCQRLRSKPLDQGRSSFIRSRASSTCSTRHRILRRRVDWIQVDCRSNLRLIVRRSNLHPRVCDGRYGLGSHATIRPQGRRLSRACRGILGVHDRFQLHHVTALLASVACFLSTRAVAPTSTAEQRPHAQTRGSFRPGSLPASSVSHSRSSPKKPAPGFVWQIDLELLHFPFAGTNPLNVLKHGFSLSSV